MFGMCKSAERALVDDATSHLATISRDPGDARAVFAARETMERLREFGSLPGWMEAELRELRTRTGEPN